MLAHPTPERVPEPRSVRIQRRHVEQPCAFVRFRARPADVARRVRRGIERVLRAVADEGAQPAGPPYLAVHEADADSLELEVGVSVDRMLLRGDGVRSGAIPMGRYLTVVEDGSHGALGDLTRNVGRWLAAQHETTVGPLYLELTDVASSGAPARVNLQIKVMAGTLSHALEDDYAQAETLVEALKALADARSALAAGVAREHEH